MHPGTFIEALCTHGIGHHKGVHGCDGCCTNAPAAIWKDVSADEPEKDELFDDAAKLVRDKGRVSATILISHLNVTYTKAAQLIDQLEAHGIIGPKDGGKPRKVL